MTGYPQAHWEQVADVYREALENDEGPSGPRPAVYIAETWGTSVNNAHYWIKVARRKGLIDPTIGVITVPGRARCRGRCPVCCPKPES